ncbi:MAG: SDR family oxidoreductase [Firmicutes bacterium]|nr:SDR family oxidoreductase [Bacillota bacterium]
MLALITGAGRGIGKAAAERFRREGWEVAEVAHRTDCDLRDSAQVEAFAKKLMGEKGCPDVIVNCAGIAQQKQLQDVSEAEWDDMMDSDLKAAYLVIRAFLPAMISRKSGSIVNVASMWGETGASMEAHYSAAKGGLIALTKALAKELGPSGIRVNCVSPGCIRTRMLGAFSEAELRALEEETPLGRIGEPEEAAAAIYFLAGPEASFITGQVLGVNGGMVI